MSVPSANPVLLLTGGAQGIGRATASAFLKAGYAVVFLDMNRKAGEDALNELDSDRLHFLHGDVSDSDFLAHSVKECIRLAGPPSVLINNAALVEFAPPETLPLENWNRVLATNLTAPFLLSRECAPHMKRLPGASIINIASTRAFQSEPHTESYSATKGGLVSLTHALAVSLGPEIRVLCISPGWIDTSRWKPTYEREDSALRPVDHEQHPAGRVGIPEDVARMALFCASEENSFLTGGNFMVDGGMSRRMIYVE